MHFVGDINNHDGWGLNLLARQKVLSEITRLIPPRNTSSVSFDIRLFTRGLGSSGSSEVSVPVPPSSSLHGIAVGVGGVSQLERERDQQREMGLLIDPVKGLGGGHAVSLAVVALTLQESSAGTEETFGAVAGQGIIGSPATMNTTVSSPLRKGVERVETIHRQVRETLGALLQSGEWEVGLAIASSLRKAYAEDEQEAILRKEKALFEAAAASPLHIAAGTGPHVHAGYVLDRHSKLVREMGLMQVIVLVLFLFTLVFD
jgi:hypothetical protein